MLTVRTGVLKQRLQIAPHFDGSNCAYHDGVVAALVLAVDFAAESDGGVVKHGAEGAQLVGNLSNCTVPTGRVRLAKCLAISSWPDASTERVKALARLSSSRLRDGFASDRH